MTFDHFRTNVWIAESAGRLACRLNRRPAVGHVGSRHHTPRLDHVPGESPCPETAPQEGRSHPEWEVA